MKNKSILTELEKLEQLVNVPSVDERPDESINAMKMLNMIVKIRELVAANSIMYETPKRSANKEISALIDNYKVKLAKIEKATNTISDWTPAKAWKASAAKQTKNFLTVLRRLQRGCWWMPSKDQAVNKGYSKALSLTDEFHRRRVCRERDDDIYYSGWMDCYDWIANGEF